MTREPEFSCAAEKCARRIEVPCAFLEECSSGNAIKFFTAASEMLDLLTEFPFMGAIRPPSNARLHSIRVMHIKGFENYVLFYRPLASKDGIVVHHVLHGSRDAEPLLESSLEEND